LRYNKLERPGSGTRLALLYPEKTAVLSPLLMIAKVAKQMVNRVVETAEEAEASGTSSAYLCGCTILPHPDVE
jgi:hypothetical protein